MGQKRCLFIPKKVWDDIFEKKQQEGADFAAALGKFLLDLEQNPNTAVPPNLGKKEPGKAFVFYPYKKINDMRLVVSLKGGNFIFEKFVSHKDKQYSMAIRRAENSASVSDGMMKIDVQTALSLAGRAEK